MIYKNSLKSLYFLKKKKGRLKTFQTALMLYYLKLCRLDLFSLDVMSVS